MGLDWIDEFVPSLDGIRLKEKKRKDGATGPRDVNEGAAKKLLKTPGQANAEEDDAIDDNKKVGLSEHKNGRDPNEASTKGPKKGAIVKMRG